MYYFLIDVYCPIHTKAQGVLLRVRLLASSERLLKLLLVRFKFSKMKIQVSENLNPNEN